MPLAGSTDQTEGVTCGFAESAVIKVDIGERKLKTGGAYYAGRTERGRTARDWRNYDEKIVVAAMCAAAALSPCAELDERQESKIAKEE